MSLLKTLLSSLRSDLIICIENQEPEFKNSIHLGGQCVQASFALLELLKLKQEETLFGEINNNDESHDGLCDGTCRIKDADGKFIEFQTQGKQASNYNIYILTPTYTEVDMMTEIFDKSCVLMGVIELNNDKWIKIKENKFSTSCYYDRMDLDTEAQERITYACKKSQKRCGELAIVDFGFPFPNWRFHICYIGDNKISKLPRFAYFGLDSLAQRETIASDLENFFNTAPVMMGLDEYENGVRRTLFFNETTKKFLTQCSVEGVGEDGWKKYIVQFEEHYRRTLRDKVPVLFELDYPMKSGERSFYNGVISCLSNHNGLSRHAFILIEITQQKKIEGELAKVRKELEDRIRSELQETQDRFRSLVINAPSTIMTVDHQGTIVFANRNFTKEQNEASLEGRSISTVVTDGPTILNKVKEVFETNDQVTIEMTLTSTEKWVSLSIGKVNDKLAIVIATDITKIKQLSEELGRAVSARSRFLANMSHEIRTPLSGIIGMSRMLSDTGLSIDQADCVSTIQQCGETLLSVINDVLDYTKLEATGEMEILHEPFSLQQVLEDSLYTVVPLAEKKGLELILDIEPATPNWLVGDQLRLRQILVNLLNNSTKFTASGYIKLAVYAEKIEDTDNDFLVNLKVKDTGCGIPFDCQDKLFQMFSQVDTSTTRRFAGTGIGLALARRFSELMGGKIWVESTGIEGEGATFSVCIPTSLTEPTTPPSSELSPCSIALCTAAKTAAVIISKNEHAAVAIKKRLQQKGFPNIFILSQISHFQPGNYSDVDHIVCFLDTECEYWDLPRSSNPVIAYVFMGTKRPDIARNSPAPVLSPSSQSSSPLSISPLSSSPSPTLETIPSLQASTNSFGSTSSDSPPFPYIFDFMRKPIKDSAICRCLNYIAIQLYNLSSLSGFSPNIYFPAKKRSNTYTAYPLRIMIVEDNEINQKVIGKMLRHIGYPSFSIANNGRDALDVIEKSGVPDFIFMDVQMPVLDGVECTRILRQKYDENWPHIVALTADAFPEDRVKCLNAGMNGFLTKPLRLEQVQFALENCYTLKMKTFLDSQGSKFLGSEEISAT